MIDYDDDDHVLLTLDRGERGEVRISRSRYQGRTYTKLQLWYTAADGKLRPGRQCVTIRDHEIADVIAALQKIERKIRSNGGQRDQSTPRPGQRPREYVDEDFDAEKDRGLF